MGHVSRQGDGIAENNPCRGQTALNAQLIPTKGATTALWGPQRNLHNQTRLLGHKAQKNWLPVS